MRRIIFTVTNDLVFDQRMDRICSTLASNGYECVLIGRKRSESLPLSQKNYEQVRIPCFFSKGKAFYLEYNLKLLWYLLVRKAHGYCAIDLDTALPVWFISKLKGKQMVYDAHEFFSQMEEIISRPLIHKAWLMVERFILKRVKHGYTISDGYAKLFHEHYGTELEVIRNVPRLEPVSAEDKAARTVIYQGALNMGRGLEASIDAMQNLENVSLTIFGMGPEEQRLKQRAHAHGLNGQVQFKGALRPEELRMQTARGWVGLTLFSEEGLHHRYSLANRFFDYMHAGIPQIAMNYPEYKAFNDQWNIAVLIDELSPEAVAQAVNRLAADPALYNTLQANCLTARKANNWDSEAVKLVDFYKHL